MDWNAFWTAFFGALIVALPTILTILATWWSHKATTKALGQQVELVHEEMNGMKDELIRTTATASHAEGKAEGIEQERTRSNGKVSDPDVPGSPS